MDSGSRSAQGAGDHSRELPRASRERAATGGGDRYERKDAHDFGCGCHREGLRGEDQVVRNDCLPHAAWRLSCSEHDAGIGGPARIFCGDSRCRPKVRGARSQLTFDGLTFTAQTPNGKVQVVSRLVGRMNVYNLLAAIGAAQALGLSNEVIASGIRSLESVSGRFQRIDLGQPFLVIVDYAHTDDALENLIRTARELNPKGRIIALFGCGGEKDRTKRPVMGEVTGRLSDLTILSSDNPRSEDPLKIISDIIVGLQKTAGKYLIEPDREKAIGIAMDEARSGDIVLLTGKGHENYQILADRTFEFDDREMARRALRARGFEGPGIAQRNGGQWKGEPQSGSGFGT